MKFHPPVLKLKSAASRAGLLGTALLAATAFTAQAQNTGFGTTTPASKVTVNGNFAVGKPPAVPSGPKSPFITTAAPVGGAIIEGLTGIGAGALLPTNQLHVFAAADPVRFEGLQPGAPSDVPLIVQPDGVVKKGTSSIPNQYELIQVQATVDREITTLNEDVIFNDQTLALISPSNLFTGLTPTTVTLQPGRTYKLTFSTGWLIYAGTHFRFYNHSGPTPGYFGPAMASTNSSNGSSSGGVTVSSFITPTIPTTISVKVQRKELATVMLKATDYVNNPGLQVVNGYGPSLTVEAVR